MRTGAERHPHQLLVSRLQSSHHKYAVILSGVWRVSCAKRSRRTCGSSPKFHPAEKLNRSPDVLTVKIRLDRPIRTSWKAMNIKGGVILWRGTPFDPAPCALPGFDRYIQSPNDLAPAINFLQNDRRVRKSCLFLPPDCILAIHRLIMHPDRILASRNSVPAGELLNRNFS